MKIFEDERLCIEHANPRECIAENCENFLYSHHGMTSTTGISIQLAHKNYRDNGSIYPVCGDSTALERHGL